VGESNYGGATGGNKSAVKFAAGAEAPQEKINGCHEQGGIEGGGQTAAWSVTPKTRNDSMASSNTAPVFPATPCLAKWRHPIGALKHFARHLRVTRLIGADQTKGSEPIEEKKSAKRNKQQYVGAASRTRFCLRSLRIHCSRTHSQRGSAAGSAFKSTASARRRSTIRETADRQRALDRTAAGAFVTASAEILGHGRDVDLAFAAEADAQAAISEFAKKNSDLHIAHGERVVDQSLAIFFAGAKARHLLLRDPDPRERTFTMQIESAAPSNRILAVECPK